MVFTSTHWEPHNVEAGAVQPVTQEYAPFEPEQSGALEPHAVVHEPQVAGFDRSVSQPSPGSVVLQLPKPVLHAPSAH